MSEEKGGLGKALGDGLLWLVDNISPEGFFVVLVCLILGFILWRVSIALGPTKICWRCGGAGHVRGLLGGRKDCGWCGATGRRARVGAKK